MKQGEKMSHHMYVSNGGNEYLSKFVMDAATGMLTQEADIALDSNPGAMATTADGTLMFICFRSTKQFQSLRVNKATGALNPISTVSIEAGPPYIKTDNSGRFLLAAYYGAGAVSVNGINPDGSLSEQPLQWIETAEHAHSIQLDRSNRFAFVPHPCPTNAIYQFRFDETTGALTANDPPKIQPETEEGPRHFVFHPDKDILYSINEDGSTVSAHHFDNEKGTLSSFQVISTLPADWDGESKTAEIRITPDGRHLYASNRGHESLAIFSVAADGTLAAQGHQPTDPTPRFFTLDPGGNFVISAGQKTGHIVTYKIDHDSGQLNQLERIEVGQSPGWIQFVENSR
jgi:6-phosphogluconolactonase